MPSKLYLENYFSHKKSEIDFSLFNSALLIGNTEGDYTKSNGSGKSAIFESILWCLFNKSRVSMMDDVIRWGENTCKVSLEFIHDEKTYKVIRSRNRLNSSSSVEFKVLDSFGDWKDISCSTSGDTNKKIEEVIRLDYKTFINSVYFRQNDISEFAESEPSRKKEILKSIVDISRWDEYEKSSKSKSKELQLECKILQASLEDYDKTKNIILDTESEIEKVSNLLSSLNDGKIESMKNLSILKNTYESIKKSLDTSSYDKIVLDIDLLKKEGRAKSIEIEKLENTINLLKKNLNAEMQKLSLIEKDCTETILVPENIIEDLNAQLTYHKSNIISLKSSLEKILLSKDSAHNLTCPTCNREFSEDSYNEFLKAQEETIYNLKKSIQDNKIEADSVSSNLTYWNKIIRDNMASEKALMQKTNIEYRISILNNDIGEKTEAFSLLEKEISLIKESLNLNKKLLDSIKNEDFQEIRSNIKKQESALLEIDKEISENDKMLGRLQERLSVLTEKMSEMSNSKVLYDEKIKKIAVFDKLTKLLSKSGIQTILLDSIIENLEKSSNNILQSICNEPSIIVLETQRAGSDGISTIETLDLKVRKDGNLQNFKSLSGGEKFRISLALRVAMSEISSRYGGSCLEFLLLDEVNSPLDRYGVETLFVNVIKSLEDRYKILTITHDESLKEKFDNVINVTKINGESEIEFSTR